MMKKASILAGILIATILVMAFRSSGDGYHSTLLKYSSGGPTGYSGDPASDFKNCTYCHAGADAQNDTSWIASNIPGSGYLPNTTYSITTTATGSGSEKFGFQISPQNSEGIFLGTLVSTGSETALTSNSNYITHTSEGTSGSGSKTWTFDWTSPDAGSGEVTFYGAFNLANNDGRNSGDTIVLSTMVVKESTTGIDGLLHKSPGIKLYPNPARDQITFETGSRMPGLKYFIIDLAGRQVMSGQISSPSTTLEIRHLKPGLYSIRIGDRGMQVFQVVK